MQLLSYDDIVLVPQYSELSSRSNGNTSVEFLGKNFKLPVIPANMQDVIGLSNAKWLVRNEYFYIMHRFGDMNLNYYDALTPFAPSISVGVKNLDKVFLESLQTDIFPDYITIDVAHAHHSHTKDMVEFIQSLRPVTKAKIIAGNVATADGYRFLCDLGVDAVKVGIGGGSICTTKYQTGFHIPTAYSVWECAQVGLDVPIIADGGLRHYGDVAKALTLGATMVMSGGWFASCIDSPAKIIHGKKVYRGSTSYEAKGHNNHIEGRTLELEEGATYADRMYEIQQALQSSISYAGGKDLNAFNSVEWKLL